MRCTDGGRCTGTPNSSIRTLLSIVTGSRCSVHCHRYDWCCSNCLGGELLLTAFTGCRLSLAPPAAAVNANVF
jgi:hypothetical protein